MTMQNADMHTTDLQLDLARRIVAHLRDRSAPAGARVSSAELAAEFRVSRSPVTRALSLLLDRGILEKTSTGRLAVVRDMAGVELDAVAPASETEELFTRIMRDRARGELPAEVSESELIPRYGASRGLIRRLMMRFAAEGLAERQQGHGWRFVASLDATQLKASYQFRLIVECSAFRIPGYDAQPERVEQLRLGHERILGLGRNAGADEWFQVNAGFHEALASFSGNPFLVSAVQQQNSLRRMWESAIYQELSIDRIRISCNEHLSILDAVDKGNLEWAESLMREHLKKAGGL